jgi:hypothetical protein
VRRARGRAYSGTSQHYPSRRPGSTHAHSPPLSAGASSPLPSSTHHSPIIVTHPSPSSGCWLLAAAGCWAAGWCCRAAARRLRSFLAASCRLCCFLLFPAAWVARLRLLVRHCSRPSHRTPASCARVVGSALCTIARSPGRCRLCVGCASAASAAQVHYRHYCAGAAHSGRQQHGGPSPVDSAALAAPRPRRWHRFPSVQWFLRPGTVRAWLHCCSGWFTRGCLRGEYSA